MDWNLYNLCVEVPQVEMINDTQGFAVQLKIFNYLQVT